MTACPECGSPTPCAKCAAGLTPCLTPTQCDKAAGCFVCDPCPGDSTHLFHKDEAPCMYCHRYLTEHKILEKK